MPADARIGTCPGCGRRGVELRRPRPKVDPRERCEGCIARETSGGRGLTPAEARIVVRLSRGEPAIRVFFGECGNAGNVAKAQARLVRRGLLEAVTFAVRPGALSRAVASMWYARAVRRHLGEIAFGACPCAACSAALRDGARKEDFA